MPIYEYTCKNCGAQLELLVRGDETPQCPKCQSKRLEKQFSIPAASTRGSGGADCLPSGG